MMFFLGYAPSISLPQILGGKRVGEELQERKRESREVTSHHHWIYPLLFSLLINLTTPILVIGQCSKFVLGKALAFLQVLIAEACAATAHFITAL